MQRQQGTFVQDGMFPVFAVPASLTFVADDHSTYKQVLTLYNPYDFPLKFKVLSTAPKNYEVANPSGVIKPRHVLDIVIRHKAVSSSNIGVSDKFRIHIYEQGQHQILGRKDVCSILVSGRTEADHLSAGETEIFAKLPNIQKSITQQHQYSIQGSRQVAPPYSLAVGLAVVCVLVLMLPTEGIDSSELPPYLHLPFIYKLIASFVLGILTVLLLRA